MMKKVILAVFVAFIALGIYGCTDREPIVNGEDATLEITTDADPIVNRFPGLPENPTAFEWTSRDSDDLGLKTTWLYAYVFYEPGVLEESFSALNNADIDEATFADEFYFVPENLSDDNTGWKQIVPASSADLQEGIDESQQWIIQVFVNYEKNVLYIHAARD